MIVAGIGCRAEADADSIVRLVEAAAARCGELPAVLAAPWFRDGSAATDAAARLGLALRIVGRDALLFVQPDCLTRSGAALRAHGIASVAEGCALASAGAGATLRLPRIAANGVTCAIAEGSRTA